MVETARTRESKSQANHNALKIYGKKCIQFLKCNRFVLDSFVAYPVSQHNFRREVDYLTSSQFLPNFSVSIIIINFFNYFIFFTKVGGETTRKRGKCSILNPKQTCQIVNAVKMYGISSDREAQPFENYHRFASIHL